MKARSIDQRAQNWIELEGAICDIAEMAAVCGVLMKRLSSEVHAVTDPNLNKENAIRAVQDATRPVSFSIHHLDEMARRLRAVYYAKPEPL